MGFLGRTTNIPYRYNFDTLIYDVLINVEKCSISEHKESTIKLKYSLNFCVFVPKVYYFFFLLKKRFYIPLCFARFNVYR